MKKRQKERVWENVWRDYSWKFPQHGKGNRQSSPRGTKSPIQHKPRRNMPIQFSSVTQSCLTPCESMNLSTPGFPVHHQLLESTQTHVHWVGDDIQPSHPLSSPFSSCPQSLPASGSFQMSQLSASGGQSIGTSASTSVLPMNTQDWSPLGWTGWISLQAKGLSRVFSTTTDKKHQLFGPQLFL